MLVVNITAIFTVNKPTNKSQNGPVATTCDDSGYCGNLLNVFRCDYVIVAWRAFWCVFLYLYMKMWCQNSVFHGIGPIFQYSLIRPWDKISGRTQCTFWSPLQGLSGHIFQIIIDEGVPEKMGKMQSKMHSLIITLFSHIISNLAKHSPILGTSTSHIDQKIIF